MRLSWSPTSPSVRASTGCAGTSSPTRATSSRRPSPESSCWPSPRAMRLPTGTSSSRCCSRRRFTPRRSGSSDSSATCSTSPGSRRPHRAARSPTSAKRSRTPSSATGRQRPEAGSRSTSTSRRFAGSTCSSRAEPTDVAVALDNLLDNAIAYTETGGATIAVDRRRDGGQGPGRRHRRRHPRRGPAARLRALLPRRPRKKPRERRHRPRPRLVRHVVERSGGTVVVASEEGVGSTFTVSLPRAV